MQGKDPLARFRPVGTRGTGVVSMTPGIWNLSHLACALLDSVSLCLWTWPCVLDCGRRFAIVLSALTGEQRAPTQRLVQYSSADKTIFWGLYVTNSHGVEDLSTLSHGHHGGRNSLGTISMSWSMPIPCISKTA